MTLDSVWLYLACGLVRIGWSELDAWASHPKQTIHATVFDSSDGVSSHRFTGGYNAVVAKSADGKLWFVRVGGVSVIDPHHLAFNKLPPPVHIEQLTADGKMYDATNGLRLPARTSDLLFDFTALSFVAPEKVRFRVKLEGQDKGWRELVNQRHVHYTNLPPGTYRFRVIACNNSGVWNEEGALLDFSIAPAFYQTNWFRALCVVAFLALLWALYRFRVRQLRQREKELQQTIDTMPAMAFSDAPGRHARLRQPAVGGLHRIKRRAGAGSDWQAAAHPDDLGRVLEKWRASLATGEPLEVEARFRRAADGQYRWFLTRAVPLRDMSGKIVKWYGVTTDIEERERLRQLETELQHINRLSMLGELTASLAHEINQPIAAAITSAGACLRWLDRDQPEVERAREAAKRIENDGRRAADIIARLKNFYKKEDSPQREMVAVNEVVGEMLVLLRSEADRHSVVMRTELTADVPAVRADRVQLQQVLMNLMLNGIEAMRGAPGELTIKSEQSDGHILVSVSDTGVGLPPGNRDELFNAFFTTKPDGTGMGLAISSTIIESHGGRLWAEANQGRGATFHFTLPTQPEAHQ